MIHETRKRSLTKALAFRIIEITVDSMILSFFVMPMIALGLAVVIEFLCLLTHYAFERMWNRINFGRYVK